MSKVLGLDLGTNSIGWSLIERNDFANGKILGAGVRIIPMSQDILGKFDAGQSISQTAERTRLRSMRRLRERHLLRRERLHRVLNILGFLPEHYASQIDFDKHPGQIIPEAEPKIAYRLNRDSKKNEFVFVDSFEEMLADFQIHQPQLVADNRKIPYDWTIYYLRKKALTQKIQPYELAWLLLHFNQKRGYYQLRGEEEEETPNKLVEFYALKVTDVVDNGDKKGNETWYNVHLENGWIYRRTSRVPLDWVGKTKEFIVTTELNEDGSIKKDKEGKERRSFRAPAEDDWTLRKKRTEQQIDKSNKHVGEYIYDMLLKNPDQKIKGKLVRVIERKFYKKELEDILRTQMSFHPQLRDTELYNACIDELYPYNEAHWTSIHQKDFLHLFVNDIIFYQRPLKSKKSLISNCKFEVRRYKDSEGIIHTDPLKGIAKSHPLFQEFRLWQFIQNLKIYRKEAREDINVTWEFFKTDADWTDLFDWLNERQEISQKDLLKYLKIKKTDDYRWNYVEDKTYPCNETRGLISKRLKKVENIPEDFLTRENEEALWHILYSVEDRNDIIKALGTFAAKHSLDESFVEQFRKFPRIEKEYGAYSAKAIKKLLPLIRKGKYWKEEDVIPNIPAYQENIQRQIQILQSKDDKIKEEDREKGKSINTSLLEKLEQFGGDIDAYKGLPHFMASYLVYGRHSEDSDVQQWKNPAAIDKYLADFRQHSLRNPIVEQVIMETLRVVRDIWIKFGNGAENFFDEIHIELGREMKNPADKRKEITNRINENENTNLRIKALLMELMNGGDTENVRPYSPMQQEILKIYEEGVLSARDGEIPDEIIRISKQAVPTAQDLRKYKLWLQQGYHSPYTGKIIPLNRLFTRDYDIEHVIPQSRYFDDSLSNKVICETAVNSDKGNMTALQYIKRKGGSKVTLGQNGEIDILTQDKYEEFVKRHFSKARGKMKKLLMEEIPDGFIERQMNDSRYISKVVKGLLSNIVREENEPEAVSKNVISITGAITSQMKQDWGLEHVWNEIITPRFIRMNKLTKGNAFGDINPSTNKFLPQVPLEHQKGYSRKRIDHRHHALDAITIACVSREHVNYLNSINAERTNYGLVSRLRETEEIMMDGQKRTVARAFHKPWPTFTQDVRDRLKEIVVSFKQNLRVVNTVTNHSLHWEKDNAGILKKKLIKQAKGENLAIRKSMHKDTVFGAVTLRMKKTVSLSVALDNWEMICDKGLKDQVKQLKDQQYDKKKIIAFFKERDNQWNDRDISKVEIFYLNTDNAAVRVGLDDSFDSSKISAITDTGIQVILLNHLSRFDEHKDGKKVERPDLAFSPDGIDELNRNIKELNGGRDHKPIFKVRKYEPKGNKFSVGQAGNKKDKFVEADKGTNLFFAIYQDEAGKRNYETIPLNIAIERQKQEVSAVPEFNSQGHPLIMTLSPNDLVYVPSIEEQASSTPVHLSKLNVNQASRIYKMVSSTGNECFFIRQDIAAPILNKFEFSPLNKMARSIDGFMIKEVCIKLNVDRLGMIIPG